MEKRLISIAALASCLVASAGQLKARFSYSTTGFRDILTHPATSSNTPAFLIFDTNLQQVKVFNFIDKELQTPDAFEQYRTFEVKKRESNDAILSLYELFNFSSVIWEANKEKDYGDGMIVYMTFSVDEFGEWFGSEYGGLLGTGSSGSGTISSFEPFIPITGHSSPSIKIQESFYYVRTPTLVGYSYKLFSTEVLGSWNEITPRINANLSKEGDYIGSGELIIMESGRNHTRAAKKFYRTVITPLEFTD